MTNNIVMDAVEFSGKIEGGVIRLPKEYGEYDNTYARVIVLVDKPADVLTKKEKLMKALHAMKKVDMFSKIDDPVSWQKKQRNEWE